MGKRVVGIDVGGERKGYHAVLLCDGKFKAKIIYDNPKDMAKWCAENEATVVAVDAPCLWSKEGNSRAAERILNKKGIHCFYTPTKKLALKSRFYDWMFNGESLYKALATHYHVYQGKPIRGPVYMETFPHAIVCALEGDIISAKNKNKTRRRVLSEQGIEDSLLPCIDFVDAALCAVAADYFCADDFDKYGDDEEGYIVVPRMQ